MSLDPHYSEEEAEQILRLATHRSASGVTRDRLLEMGAELGLSPDAVREAEAQVIAEREDRRLRREYANYSRKNLMSCLWTFVTVNAMFLWLDYFKDHHLGWSLLCLGVWALGLVSQIISTFAVNTDKYEAAYRTWLEKRNSPEKKIGYVNLVLDSGTPRQNVVQPSQEVELDSEQHNSARG